METSVSLLGCLAGAPTDDGSSRKKQSSARRKSPAFPLVLVERYCLLPRESAGNGEVARGNGRPGYLSDLLVSASRFWSAGRAARSPTSASQSNPTTGMN
jgi:hypothetical protein